MKHNRTWLMEQLHDGRIFSVEDLCNELGRTDRTVRRIIDELRREGAPIESEVRSGNRKYFYIREEKRRPALTHTLNFNEDEVLALWVAVQAARAALAPTPLVEPLDTAFSSLKTVLSKQSDSFHIPNQAQHWHFGNAPSVQLDHEVFNLLRRAIADRQSVRCDYNAASSGTESKSRKLDPYSFALRGTTWMLVARCHTKNRTLDFALTDISNVQLCDPKEELQSYFDFPEDFDLDVHFRDRFNALAGGKPHTVKILVAKNRAQYFRRKLYHPTQQIETEHPDGTIEVSYDVLGLDEIRSFVQSWGVGVTVLEPGELREMIKQEVHVLIQRYEDSY